MWEHTEGNATGNYYEHVAFCIDAATGMLHSANRTYRVGMGTRNTSEISRTVFHNVSLTPPASDFATPSTGCVDLRPLGTASTPPSFPSSPSSPSSSSSTRINDRERIDRIAREATVVGWTPGINRALDGETVGSMARRLGALRHSWSLPLPSPAHLSGLADYAGSGPIPTAFDARTRWPGCNNIGTPRSQGKCGSCWAFGAAEALADRFCVAQANGRNRRLSTTRGVRATATAGETQMDRAHTHTPYTTNLTNLTLSVEYLLDCDQDNAGCGGGLLDDAWLFLSTHGLPSETCIPYQQFMGPTTIPCGALGHCLDGAHSPLVMYRAASAYAVAPPGDAVSMQVCYYIFQSVFSLYSV